jgi:hypothetical protein
MKFLCVVQRNPVGGNDIDIQIQAEDKEMMRQLALPWMISNCAMRRFQPRSISWQKTFVGAGSAAPNITHVLVVAAHREEGERVVCDTRVGRFDMNISRVSLLEYRYPACTFVSGGIIALADMLGQVNRH